MRHKALFGMKAKIAPLIRYESMLKFIEKELIKRKIYKVQWPKNDLIIKSVKINDFKLAGEKCLEKLQIIIVAAAEAITDKNKQFELMTKYHSDPLFGGHMGKKKLYEKLRASFYWKNMNKDIAKFINACQKCHLNKPKRKIKPPMHITSTPQSSFDTIIIDTIGPFPESPNGNKFAVTMVCDMSKFLVIAPIPNKEAKTVAKAIFTEFILIFGVMKELRSDCGTEYKNEIVANLCEMLKIDHKFSSPYHHESVGSIERNHRFFNQYIRNYVNEFGEWEEYLRYFTFCYNISPHSSFNDKYSPYQIVFNRAPNLPHNLTNSVEPIYNIDDYVKEAKYRLQKSHLEAQKMLNASKIRNKIQFDKNSNDKVVKINDEIYISAEPYDKRKNVNDGPYIVKKIKKHNVVLEHKVNKSVKEVHKNRIRY